MMPVEDWELARHAAAGDNNAFTALVRRYQKPIIHFCYRMTGSLPDAEDIAQEAFINLYRSLGRLRQASAFSTVLFCYARNAAMNHLRAAGRLRRRLAAFEQAQGDPGARAARPDDTARAEELSAVLEAGVSVLAAEYREVFVLREFQRLNYQAIAKIVGCPVGTVRSRLARAREQVRAHVATRYGEDWC